jgi:hypothetical protein
MWWHAVTKSNEHFSPSAANNALCIRIREHGPIRARLAQQCPEMTDAELDQYVASAEHAHRRLGELFEAACERSTDLPAWDLFHRLVQASMPWVAESNAGGFYSQCIHSLLK